MLSAPMNRAPLPIDDVLPSLLGAMADNPSAILAAPPGAGKTTRVPLALVDAPWRGGRKIVMLEPRRIAARAAAERLAAELGEKPGQTVGYQIRGESKKGAVINVVTEGVLTRMIQSDAELPDIAAILFDEAHERSIHSDLGLALSLDIQGALRPDLRLLVMSATLDTETFAATMGDAPVIESPGKIFPVETHWLSRPWKKPGRGRRGFEAAVADLTVTAMGNTEGDVLVFLPGVGEITRTRAHLDQAKVDADVEVLHGSLPFREQAAVLKQRNAAPRRIILTTAIAETSLTVPGVRVVVDGGLARRARTDPSSGLSRLVTAPVSRAQADQRRGRAGRLGPGTCYRLWTKGEEGGLPVFAPPEILETELSALVLELALWGVGDPSDLSFLTAPPKAAIEAAKTLLTDLGALDGISQITPHGRAIASKPMHPRLAHMMAVAEAHDLQAEAAVIAALLSDRDPLPHGSPADLNDRIKAILGDRTAPDAKPALDRIRADAKRHTKVLPRLDGVLSAAGILTSLAYPDRIAKRRDGEAPRFLLSGGRGAVMEAKDPLSSQHYLVATDLEDGTEARIRVAAMISETELRQNHADRITQTQTAEWFARHRRVEARQKEMLGALALTDRPWKDAPPDLLGQALADGIRQTGVSALPWSKTAKALRNRVAWLNVRNDGSIDLPDWSDTALSDPDTWLTPHLSGLTRLEQVADLDLVSILKAGVDWNVVQQIDQLAPKTFSTPLGRQITIDYTSELPSITLKVQELYGVKSHPTIGHPPLPLAIEMVSPANRPVQKTADLPGFWQNSYKDVRKDMRARYPRHHWPEDPTTATPMERTRKPN